MKIKFDALVKFFREKTDVSISARVEGIIQDQEIDGMALAGMSVEKLESYGIPGGPALNIFNFVTKLK